MHRLFKISIVALSLTLLPTMSLAKSFVPLPTKDAKSKNLRVKFVKYTGGSSGKMIVDIRNVGQKRTKFVAKGLFFVPNGDPEKAPQRLGAAGPFENMTAQSTEPLTEVWVKPGKTLRLKLQVFCLDSHRGSPSSTQGFHVGRKLLPKKLQGTIEKGANGILHKHKGNRGAANSEIQGHVWKTRNKKWIKIEGERKNEQNDQTSPNSTNNRIQIQRRLPNIYRQN